MEKPEKPSYIPKWLKTQHYEGIEQDVSEYWIAVKFYEIVDEQKIGEEYLDDPYVVNRIMAQATMAAESHIQNFSTEVAQRARVWMVYRAGKEGLYKDHPQEYSTMREMIADMIDPDKDEYYNESLLIWADQILPALEGAGVPIDKIVGAKDGGEKMRETRGKIMKALNEGNVDRAAAIAHAVATNSLHGMRDAVRKMDEKGEEIPRVPLTWYHLGDGRLLAVLECNSLDQRQLVQWYTRKFVSEHMEEAPAGDLISKIMTEMGYVPEAT